MMPDIFEEEKREKEEERAKSRHYITLAVGAFGALAALAIIIITQKLFGYNVITVLFFLMLLVLILGFWGPSILSKFKEYLEKRKYNELAKFHYKKFKEFVIRFREFTENRYDSIEMVVHSIKKDTHAPNPFSQVNVIQPMFIQSVINTILSNSINSMGLRIV